MVWYNPFSWGEDNSKPVDDVIIDNTGGWSFGGIGPYEWEMRQQAYRQKNPKGYQRYLADRDGPPPFLKKNELEVWCKESGVVYSYQDVQNYYNGKTDTLVPKQDYRSLENDALAEEVDGEDVFDEQGVYRGPDGGVDGVQIVAEPSDALPHWLQEGMDLSTETEEAVSVSTHTANGGRLYEPYDDTVMADVVKPGEKDEGWLDQIGAWFSRQADAVAGWFSSDEKPDKPATQPAAEPVKKPAKTGQTPAPTAPAAGQTPAKDEDWLDQIGAWFSRQADAVAGWFSSDEKPDKPATQPAAEPVKKPAKTGQEEQTQVAGEKPNAAEQPNEIPGAVKNPKTHLASERPALQQFGQQEATGPALAGDVEVLKGVTADEMRKSGKFTEFEIQEIYSRGQEKARAVMQNPDLSAKLKAAGKEVTITQDELGVTRSQIIALGKMSKEG